MRSREQPAALDRAGVRRTEPFGRIVWATAIGIGYAVALIPGSLVHGVAFGAEHGDVNPLIHGGWDAAAALPFAVASLALWAFIVGLPSERGFVTSDSGSTPGQPGLTGPSSDLPEATTIDSQTFGPGEAFTEDILFGAG